MNNEIFSLSLKVRDYECDTGGGVNNAVYLHYLECGRFEFLRQVLKWDLRALTAQHIGFVVARIEVDYRRSLIPGEEFVLETSMERIAQNRFAFTQDIYRTTNKKVILNAKAFCVAVNNVSGRAEVSEYLEALLREKYPWKVTETDPV